MKTLLRWSAWALAGLILVLLMLLAYAIFITPAISYVSARMIGLTGSPVAFPFLREESFRRELLLEFLERDLQRANALQLHGANDELILPARLIDRHVALQQNLPAVRQQLAM